MRAGIAVLALLISVIPTLAQTRDPSDRTLGPEMSRDRAESRIERLHDDKDLQDKARAEMPKMPKKRTVRPNKKLNKAPTGNQK